MTDCEYPEGECEFYQEASEVQAELTRLRSRLAALEQVAAAARAVLYNYDENQWRDPEHDMKAALDALDAAGEK
ncbi:MAG TPA: hypothetical protein VD930_03630 [Gemmatimonadales bacterium]|nr:hypothetical protein [Gemmatimonadales bacterium]